MQGVGRGRVGGEGRLLETETGCRGRSGEGEEWQEEEGGGEEAQEGTHGGKDRGVIGESRCGGLCVVILYGRPSSKVRRCMRLARSRYEDGARRLIIHSCEFWRCMRTGLH